MIRIACPKCKKALQADPAAAGSVMACPDCGQKMRVPIPRAQPVAPAPSPPPAPPAAKPSAPAPEPVVDLAPYAAPAPPAPAEEPGDAAASPDWALDLGQIKRPAKSVMDDDQADLSQLGSGPRARPELLDQLSPALQEKVAVLGEPTSQFKRKLGTETVLIGLGILGVTLIMVVVLAAISMAGDSRGRSGAEDPLVTGLSCLTLPLGIAGVVVTLLGLPGAGRRVMLFTGGFLDVRPGKTIICPWDEVEAIWQDVTRVTVMNQFGVVLRKYTKHCYHVLLEDGTKLRYDDRTPNVAVLGPRIIQETREPLLARALKRYNAGKLVDFDDFAIDRKGLDSKDDRLPWRELRDVKVFQGKITVYCRGQRRPPGPRGSSSSHARSLTATSTWPSPTAHACARETPGGCGAG